MGRKLINVVKPKHIELIKEDFLKVVDVLYSCNLIKGRNVSRYRYYIIRLCHRRRFECLKKVADLKDGKVKDKFDNNLFGVVYPKLNWVCGGDQYYDEWLRKNMCRVYRGYE